MNAVLCISPNQLLWLRSVFFFIILIRIVAFHSWDISHLHILNNRVFVLNHDCIIEIIRVLAFFVNLIIGWAADPSATIFTIGSRQVFMFSLSALSSQLPNIIFGIIIFGFQITLTLSFKYIDFLDCFLLIILRKRTLCAEKPTKSNKFNNVYGCF